MKGRMYAPPRTAVPVNLLGNSDFRDPVNGRGAVHYTANGYTIDRWLLWESAGNVALTVGGGMIYWRGYLYQHLAIDTARRYTLAACTSDGDILCVSGTPSEKLAVTSLGNLQLILTVSYPDGQYVKAQVSTIDPSQASSLVWAALYEGTYTTDTLPPYVPRPYSVELAECRRWFLPLDASKWYMVVRPHGDNPRLEVPGSFARAPTLIGTPKMYLDDGVWHDMTPGGISLLPDRCVFRMGGYDDLTTQGSSYILIGVSGVSCEI